ncbi:hypothetical protein [Nocardia sp. IFM 10818]
MALIFAVVSLFVGVFVLSLAVCRLPVVARRIARAEERDRAQLQEWEHRMGRRKTAADEWRDILGY